MVCEIWDLGGHGGHTERGLGGLRPACTLQVGGCHPAQEAAPASGGWRKAGLGLGWARAELSWRGRGGGPGSLQERWAWG